MNPSDAQHPPTQPGLTSPTMTSPTSLPSQGLPYSPTPYSPDADSQPLAGTTQTFDMMSNPAMPPQSQLGMLPGRNQSQLRGHGYSASNPPNLRDATATAQSPSRTYLGMAPPQGLTPEILQAMANVGQTRQGGQVAFNPPIQSALGTLQPDPSVMAMIQQGGGPSANNRKLGLFKTELCRRWEENGSCRYGEKCQFAHGEAELRHAERHPKAEICRTFWASGSCPYGNRCRFIHALPANAAARPSQNPKADHIVWCYLRKVVSSVANARMIDVDSEDPQDVLGRPVGEDEEAGSTRDASAATTLPLPSMAEDVIRKGKPVKSKVEKWFNLEAPDLDASEPTLDLLKQIVGTIDPPPLIVQVLLFVPQPLLDNDRVLILSHGDHQTRFEPTPRYVLLESWRVDIVRRSPPPPSPSFSTGFPSSLDDTRLPETYKQLITLFRSIYTLLRILPAWKLRRQLEEMGTGSGNRMNLELRVGVPSQSASSTTESVGDLAPVHDNIPIIDFNVPLSQHQSANKVESMVFPSIATQLGDLNLSLNYRVETNFRLAPLDSLQSSPSVPTDSKIELFALTEPLSISLIPSPTPLILPTPPISPKPTVSSAIPPTGWRVEDEMRPPQVPPTEEDKSDLLAHFASIALAAEQPPREESLDAGSATSGQPVEEGGTTETPFGPIVFNLASRTHSEHAAAGGHRGLFKPQDLTERNADIGKVSKAPGMSTSGSSNSQSQLESPIPQYVNVSLAQELACIEDTSTPSTKHIVELILALGRAVPNAIRNKHQLYRLIIKCRDLCNCLRHMAHTGGESRSGSDILERYWEMMDGLERILLELTEIVSEEMKPFGVSSLATWNNSCVRLSRIYEGTVAWFITCGINDSVHPKQDRYFDDCSWSSLLLYQGVGVPVDNMDLEGEGTPIEAEYAIHRLNYLVNEMKQDRNMAEDTRELLINILSDTATVTLKSGGLGNTSLDFWAAAAGALKAINLENRLDRDNLSALRNSWGDIANLQILPPSSSMSPAPATSPNPKPISLPEELTRLDHGVTPAAEPLVLLLQSLGRGAPTVTRNKHKIYAILDRARDICNHILAVGLRPQFSGLETLDGYYNLIEALEGVLLNVAKLLPTEQINFGPEMCVSWSESREKLCEILNELHKPPFSLGLSNSEQELANNAVFDDYYWLSLLHEGIEQELDRQYSDTAMPPAVASVRESLWNLENEIKCRYQDEATRELVIDISTRLYEALSISASQNESDPGSSIRSGESRPPSVMNQDSPLEAVAKYVRAMSLVPSTSAVSSSNSSGVRTPGGPLSPPPPRSRLPRSSSSSSIRLFGNPLPQPTPLVPPLPSLSWANSSSEASQRANAKSAPSSVRRGSEFSVLSSGSSGIPSPPTDTRASEKRAARRRSLSQLSALRKKRQSLKPSPPVIVISSDDDMEEEDEAEVETRTLNDTTARGSLEDSSLDLGQGTSEKTAARRSRSSAVGKKRQSLKPSPPVIVISSDDDMEEKDEAEVETRTLNDTTARGSLEDSSLDLGRGTSEKTAARRSRSSALGKKRQSLKPSPPVIVISSDDDMEEEDEAEVETRTLNDTTARGSLEDSSLDLGRGTSMESTRDSGF